MRAPCTWKAYLSVVVQPRKDHISKWVPNPSRSRVSLVVSLMSAVSSPCMYSDFSLRVPGNLAYQSGGSATSKRLQKDSMTRPQETRHYLILDLPPRRTEFHIGSINEKGMEISRTYLIPPKKFLKNWTSPLSGRWHTLEYQG